MKIPYIPEDAPFSGVQRAWLAGFLAGLHSRAAITAETVAIPNAIESTPQPTLDILFGTQTGNAEMCAMAAAEQAQNCGFATNVAGMEDISLEDFAQMKQVILVVSTYGEGDMPDTAELFWDALSAPTAPCLEGMKFGVIALGDTGYDEFCQAGKLMDTRLEQLGAVRLAPRIDCDVDYEDVSAKWVEETLPLISENLPQGEAPKAPAISTAKKETSAWNRKNPYKANVIENTNLSGSNSAKEIRHIAFDLKDSGITYEAGDALGVIPKNNPDLVNALLQRLGCKEDDIVENELKLLGGILTEDREISTPSKELITEIRNRTNHEELSHVVDNGDKEALESYLWGRDILDLLNLDEKLAFTAEEFLKFLKPLQHRAYSISSSPKAHENEVHLTVAAVRWLFEGREHQGVCSSYLADRVNEGTNVKIFLSANKSFRPPQDNDAPMIMVGPGTGIAPFRAFLEERRERDAKGKNWLFFGDQHREQDFIYEDEMGTMSQSGLLSRLDLAFSRDQKEKIYVQSRMKENGKDLFSWLEEGAYFYVCGDATRMAKDVDQALHEIIQEHGSLDEDQTTEYINELKRNKRYLRDVY